MSDITEDHDINSDAEIPDDPTTRRRVIRDKFTHSTACVKEMTTWKTAVIAAVTVVVATAILKRLCRADG